MLLTTSMLWHQADNDTQAHVPTEGTGRGVSQKGSRAWYAIYGV